jgi:hypothetical protein
MMGPPGYDLSAGDQEMAIIAKFIIHSGPVNRMAISAPIRIEGFCEMRCWE